MSSLGLESSYYSEEEKETKEKKMSKNEKIKLIKEFKELFDFFEEKKIKPKFLKGGEYECV